MEILERSDLGRPDDADDASYAAVNRQRRAVNGKAIMDSPHVQQVFSWTYFYSNKDNFQFFLLKEKCVPKFIRCEGC